MLSTKSIPMHMVVEKEMGHKGAIKEVKHKSSGKKAYLGPKQYQALKKLSP